MDFRPARTVRPTQYDEDVVAVYLPRNELSDTGKLGVRIAAAIGQHVNEPRRTTFAEFEPAPVHTVQDVLSGHITWEQLSAHRVS